MKITSIVENTSRVGLPVEHGLSLFVQMDDGQKVLFDMGQGKLFAHNAEQLGIDIADVDSAIVSHGHYDHAGGLGTFLKINDKAKIYIHRDAFLPHYSLRQNGLTFIGIDKNLSTNDRIVVCDDIIRIGNGMTIFSDVHGDCCYPMGNRLLYGPLKTENDNFNHEQNLIIEEGEKTVLFAGCAHKGIVNIIRKATEVIGKTPTHVFAGMHLVKSGLSEKEEDTFISHLADNLLEYHNCKFYTMHCTGTEQYEKLKFIMGNNIQYLSCGEYVKL